MADRPVRNLTVSPAASGQALAAFVRQAMGSVSWAEAKRLIAARHVQVNGNLCVDEARRLKAGETVRLNPHPLAAPPTQGDLRIRFCDAHLLVVEKPAGLTTLRHAEERDWPAQRKDKAPTLDEMLPRALAGHLGWSAVPSKPVRRGPQLIRPKAPRLPRVIAVHRLDRDTSGPMLFARTPDAERALVRMFARHEVERLYTAVCHGRLEGSRTIESMLVRDRGDGKRGSVPPGTAPPDDAQRAVTHVRAAEHLGNAYTVVECRLETGRTHQIRIHLCELGHPLCGDKVYRGPASAEPLPDRSHAPRQALHSGRIAFTHPFTGERHRFEMPMPRDLAEWLQRLRAASRDGR